jgi:serine/threonine protein kinase
MSGSAWEAACITQLDRPVATRVLPAGVAADADRQRRFRHEAKAVSALNHPNIVTIHAIVHDSGAGCIVMEHFAGRTLGEARSLGYYPYRNRVRPSGTPR